LRTAPRDDCKSILRRSFEGRHAGGAVTVFTIDDAKLHHCGKIYRRLRRSHQEAGLRLGLNTHAELQSVLRESSYARAFFADGELIALGGLTESLISPFGFVWLAITEEGARRYPIALAREARRQLDLIMRTKVELATTIIGGDEAAKRLAVFLGFHVSHDGPGSPAFTRLERKDLSRHLDSNPALRIPIGGGYAISMGVH
jgi:hypothetical protein